jgi:hypothetical protein
VVLVSSPSPPRQLAVDTFGDLYVSHDDGVVWKYDADGGLLDDAVVAGLGAGAPLAVGPGGAFGTDLYVLDPARGELLGVLGDGSVRVVGSGFPGQLGEIEFGPDGALYVASFAEGQVLRVAPLVPRPALAPLDSFLCYRAKTTPETPRFERRRVSLEDAFETGEAAVQKPKALCNPVDRDRGGIAEPGVSLEGYEVRSAGARVRRTAVSLTVTNALGTLSLGTSKRGAQRLLVPSALHASETPDPTGETSVDPYRCYPAQVTRGTPPFPEDVQVTLSGAFFDSAPRLFDVRGPKHLCQPVDVDGRRHQRRDALLVCYVKPAKGEDRHAPRTGVRVANLFGTEQLDTAERAPRVATRLRTGTVRGDTNETFAGSGTTRPGTWSDVAGTPSWAGGGPLGEGDWLRSSFADAESLPEGDVRRWRVFVEVDITENQTGAGPGVAMLSNGIPGIPDGTLLKAKAEGKPAGLRVASEWFTPPEGTTLAELAGASQELEARGDDSDEAFAFEIEDWGVEYQILAPAGGGGGGSGGRSAEEELCVPSLAAGP